MNTAHPSPFSAPAQEPAAGTAAKPALLFPLLLAACGGVAVSLALFFLVRRAERQSLRNEFDRHAYVPNTALQQDIDDYVNFLQSIDAFFHSSKDVDRREFEGFTRD